MKGLKELMDRLDRAENNNERKKAIHDFVGGLSLLETSNPLIGMVLEMAIKSNQPKIAVVMTKFVVPMINSLNDLLSPDDLQAAKMNIMDLTNLLQTSDVSMHVLGGQHTEEDCDHDCENCEHATRIGMNPMELLEKIFGSGPDRPNIETLLGALRTGRVQKVDLSNLDENHPLRKMMTKKTVH